MFAKMDKALDSSVASREIREYIKDTSKLNVLTYKTKGIISSKIYQELSQETLKEIIHELDLIEQKLKEVEQKALTYRNDYEKAIEIFEKRFRPKFTSKIVNREEALLGFSFPTIEFYHVDNKTRSMDEQCISEVLSSGELSTLKIIQLIVECEAVKNSNPLIIIDDIVETFDYANRVATLEYLHDLSKLNARIILLTHNFDFFRFATSRLQFKYDNGSTENFNRIYGYKTKKNEIVLAKNKIKMFNLKSMLNIKDEKNL